MTSTSNASLRPLEPEDLELVLRIENDADLWPWASNNVPYSRHLVRQYLESQRGDIYADGQLRQVVMSGNEPAGLVDLTDFSPRHLRAEVGIVILPELQRRGMASAALRLLHDYAARHLRLRSLYAYVAEDNLAAQTLFRSLGYQSSGILQRWVGGDTAATVFQVML